MYTTQTPFFSSFSSLTGALEETSSAPKDLPPVPQPEASSSRPRTQPNTQTPFVSSFSALSGALGQVSSSRLEAPVHTPAYYLAGAEAGASNDTTPVSSSGPRTPAFEDYDHLYDYDFHPSPSPVPLAAPPTGPKCCGVPIITGNTYLDSILIERYFPASTYNHRTHRLMTISRFHEIQRIPDWLRDVLGERILNLFRVAEGFRGNFGTGTFVPTFVPYLYLHSEQGTELLRISWEVLSRIEMCGGGQFNRGDTFTATTPNGATVSLLSREYFREIAFSDPESVVNRMVFMPPNPPSVTGGIPPYLMKAPVPDSKTKADITNDMKAWFKKMVDYLDDEPARVINMAQAIHETAVKLAAKAATAATPGPSRVAPSGKGKRKRDSDSENVEKPKKAKKRKVL